MNRVMSVYANLWSMRSYNYLHKKRGLVTQRRKTEDEEQASNLETNCLMPSVVVVGSPTLIPQAMHSTQLQCFHNNMQPSIVENIRSANTSQTRNKTCKVSLH